MRNKNQGAPPRSAFVLLLVAHLERAPSPASFLLPTCSCSAFLAVLLVPQGPATLAPQFHRRVVRNQPPAPPRDA